MLTVDQTEPDTLHLTFDCVVSYSELTTDNIVFDVQGVNAADYTFDDYSPFPLLKCILMMIQTNVREIFPS